MACKVTLTLLSESQEGNVGNDWKYTIEVKVFNEGLAGEGTISVPKHLLDSGAVEPPPGPPEPLVMAGGKCGAELLLTLKLTATEVDLIKSDTGTADSSLNVICPGPGETPLSQEIELSTGVRESPGLLNKNAVFQVAARLDVSCD
jgi:hypothetical protein